ncbi:MBG domain-containing protein [Paraflavitalea speifideaquila]|uniref:MBG domain-containing protein n=1 Tax=Paraflavitalea speifideaquila TaxID=3076558 RepID=UPI0028E20E67|nr:MBG domain-containing protein [Paraflavitalea speifideiaquila]
MASPIYSNITVKGNRAAYHGGGVYNDRSNAIYTNLLIVDNLSEFQGGGMANTNISEPILTNLTISGNNAAVEGGGYINISSNTQIRNTIVYGNNVVPYDDNSTPFIIYSLIEGLPEDINLNNLDGNQDPLFNNPAAGNYTLKTGSPAINAGSFLYFMTGQTPDLTAITTDLAGRPRTSASTTDLGAFESSNQDQQITAEDINRTYGDEDFELTAVASSGLPVTYSLANNNAVDLYQDAQDGNKWKIKIKKAGSVVITVSQGGDVTYDPAPNVEILLLVNRKELTVTADNKTRIYGASNPIFTISYAGFIGSDGVQDITAPDITTTATPASVPGNYPIILKNGDAINYDLKFVHGLLTVEGALITVNQQPTDQSICAGSSASFTTTATTAAQITISYQWQQSTDNNTWNNINGANKAQLTTAAMNDMYYRCALSVPGRVTNTNAVKLAVKPFEKPVINLPNSVCLAEGRVTLTASLPGGVFSGPGVSGATWYIDTLRPGLQSVTYAYSNNNGCSTTVSKTTSLSLCGEKNLVTVTKANPNPTTGLVTVKVLVTENARQNVIVSNAFGQQVLQKQVQLRKGWNYFTLDLTKHRAGIYFITLAGYGEGPATVVRIMKE